MPAYVTSAVTEINLPEETQLPAKPKWSTVFIAAGKKDKVNKVDIVGFLGNKGQLKKRRYRAYRSERLLFFCCHQENKNAAHTPTDQIRKDQKQKVKLISPVDGCLLFCYPAAALCSAFVASHTCAFCALLSNLNGCQGLQVTGIRECIAYGIIKIHVNIFAASFPLFNRISNAF